MLPEQAQSLLAATPGMLGALDHSANTGQWADADYSATRAAWGHAVGAMTGVAVVNGDAPDQGSGFPLAPVFHAMNAVVLASSFVDSAPALLCRFGGLAEAWWLRGALFVELNSCLALTAAGAPPARRALAFVFLCALVPSEAASPTEFDQLGGEAAAFATDALKRIAAFAAALVDRLRLVRQA